MKLNALGNLGEGEVARSVVGYHVDQHLGALTLSGKVRGRHSFVLARALLIGYMMTLEEARRIFRRDLDEELLVRLGPST
jgi:hypothetical protein